MSKNNKYRKFALLSFAAAMMPILCFGLAIPDDGEIRKNIADVGSDYYYPALMRKYLAADTTLTEAQYAHLYYGWAFQPGYEPLKTAADNGLLRGFATKDEVTEEDYREVIRFLESALGTDPFNLGFINLLSYMYTQTGSVEKAAANKRRLDMIVKTVISSGTGIKEKSPFQIIAPQHAEEVLAYLEIPHRKKQAVSIYCEYYPLLQKRRKTKGYYFDFRRIYIKVPEDAGRDFDGRQGFEINGMPVK